MNDKDKDYSNLEPIGLNRLGKLEYLKNKTLNETKEFTVDFNEDQLYSLCRISIEIERSIDETIGFLMYQRVLPIHYKQFLNVLKSLNHYLEIIKGELEKHNYLEKRKELNNLNQEIDFHLQGNSAPEDITLLSDSLEIKNEIKEYIHTQKKEKPTFHAYCEVGSLFAQGFLNRKIQAKSHIYFYKNQSFTDISSLVKHVNSILTTKKNNRQYINDTFNNSGIKNIYSHKTQMKEIIRYCEYNQIEPTQEFLKTFQQL